MLISAVAIFQEARHGELRGVSTQIVERQVVCDLHVRTRQQRLQQNRNPIEGAGELVVLQLRLEKRGNLL